MITYLYIDGFKSFCDFESYFSPYTVIAGTNASGKSNLFDAIRLLSNLAKGMTVHEALQNWRGDENEVFTLLNDGKGNSVQSNKITLKVDMLVDKQQNDAWNQKADLVSTRLRYELVLRRNSSDGGVAIVHEKLIPVYKKEDKWGKEWDIYAKDNSFVTRKRSQQRPFLLFNDEKNEGNDAAIYEASGKSREIWIKDTGRTLLSKFDDVDFPHLFAAREEMKNWHYMQLNPTDLRRASDTTFGASITPTGGQLASLIQSLKKEDSYNLTAISRLVNRFLPNYVAIDVIPDEDSKKLVLTVEDINGTKFSSRLLSEGTLRIIALCALSVNKDFYGVLCFEEPENGIHPFRLNAIASLMGNFATNLFKDEGHLRQVIVNSHSPFFVELAKTNKEIHADFYLSRMVTHITEYGSERVKVRATRISPVLDEKKENIAQLSENEIKQTEVSAKDFLNCMVKPNYEEED